jgi:hypothetical protein
VAAFCSLALFLPLTWPLLTGRVFTFDDIQAFHLPLRYVYAKALAAGHLLLWTPAVLGGVYLHGEGQVGMLHPLHLALYRGLPLQIAFNLEYLTSYVMAFAGMAWLLRRLRLRMAPALFGAMLFAFSGFHLLHLHHVNLVAVTAHLPWLLACLDLIIAGDRARERAAGFAGVALVFGSALLLGFPQGIWWNVLTSVAFAVLRAGETRRWRRLGACAAAGLTGVLLGGVQLVPTLDAAAHSVRAGIDRSFALTYSLSPWNIVQFWSPYFLTNRVFSPSDYPHVHELGIYPGTLLLIAPVWLAIRRRALGPHRRLAAACAVFALVLFVLALGSRGGLAFLLTYIPGLGWFRAPARYIGLVQFALAIMAAIALDDLVHVWRGGRLTRAQTLALCAFAVASLLTTLLWNTQVLPAPGGLPIASALRASRGTAFVVAVTIAFLLTVRRVRWAAAGLIVITAADLAFWGIGYVYRVPARTIDELTCGLQRGSVRVSVAAGLSNQPLLKGYQVVPGYLGLYPATSYAIQSDAFRRRAGAQYSVSGECTLTPLSDAMPRSRLVTAAGSAGGETRVALDEPGRLIVHAIASAPATLILTERFDDGWRVTVDQRTVHPARVDRDFLGAALAAGPHRVAFRFAPRSFVVGEWLSALGVLLLAVGTIVTLRRGTPARESD